MSLLDSINAPSDLRRLPENKLPDLATELRQEVINTVAETGGHLGASLGVIELTIALHYVFATPDDRLLFDVSHQTYPHKILTGRRKQMHTIRRTNGISGFSVRAESEYDAFGAAHSSTSLSAGMGMAEAARIKAEDQQTRVISVIGDGALSAGLAFEGLNNIGAQQSRMLIILNDNGMSIAPAVGALHHHLERLSTGAGFKRTRRVRELAKNIVQHLPGPIRYAANKTDDIARTISGRTNIFTELGIDYHGPYDGHDVIALVRLFRNYLAENPDYPRLIHLVTKKGKGYLPAEQAGENYHGVTRFDPASGNMLQRGSNQPISYTQAFADQLCRHADKDKRIVAITAAMPSGTGLKKFAELYAQRFYDVGIAEQHAVTYAAGLACEEMIPIVAIYSTFLQRAYDQIIHDVALQRLAVRFVIDRAGYVGADGATHAGSFDITYLCSIPEMVVMAPSDEAELAHMFATQLAITDRPSAMRFPRGSACGVSIPQQPTALEIGKARYINRGKTVAIIALGTCLQTAKQTAKLLQAEQLAPTIVDARFAKPVDAKLIIALANSHQLLISLEEGVIGGFAAQIQELLNQHQVLQRCDYLPMYMPDRFVNHATPDEQMRFAGLDAASVAQRVLSRLRQASRNNRTSEAAYLGSR